MAYLEYFDVRKRDLAQELTHHPELCEILARVPASEFELRLGHVAAYCGVIVDEYYSEEEVCNLCEILTKKLYEKRTMIVLR
jgi:hypothetical protein